LAGIKGLTSNAQEDSWYRDLPRSRFVVLGLVALPAFPQGERGTITGTVTDTSGGIVTSSRVRDMRVVILAGPFFLPFIRAHKLR
jgi:hypothetical protein